MFSILIRVVTFAAFALAGVWVLHAYITEEVIHESARHRIVFNRGVKDKEFTSEYIARVVWKRAFPYYNGVDVFLVVVDTNGTTLMRRPLLRDLNDPAQVPEKVHGLDWESDEKIVLTRSDLFHTFSFKPPSEDDAED